MKGNDGGSRRCGIGRVLVLGTTVLSAAASAGVANTAHNMLSDPARATSPDNREVCAFCHFPQGSAGSSQQPIWVPNGTGKSNGRFSTYPTLGITTPSDEPAGTVGSISLACLSCHDGAHATNVPIGHRGEFSHPVGVPYGRGLYSRDTGRGPSTDIRFLGPGDVEADYERPEIDIINRVSVWWVDTGELGRQRSDMQLYSRRDTFSGTEIPYVECSTCHDPHNDAAMFLRTSNEGSRLCMSCHLL